MNDRWYVLHLNPEPWAIGTISYHRMTPNAGLQAYQEAVREELADEEQLPTGEYALKFYFWRQQATYLDMGDKRRQRNQADATNMQKGLEDALQGVLFENDRNVRSVHSVIVAQGPLIKPCIVIAAKLIDNEIQNAVDSLPDVVFDEIIKPIVAPPSDNVWRGPNK